MGDILHKYWTSLV